MRNFGRRKANRVVFVLESFLDDANKSRTALLRY
jgi:hypothetical protein